MTISINYQNSDLTLAENDTHATPPSGTVRLYAKTDGFLYSKDDAGVETQLGGGGGGGAISDLTSATGTNTLTNAGNTQTWRWTTSANSGLILEDTGAAGNAANAALRLAVANTNATAPLKIQYAGQNILDTSNGGFVVNTRAIASAVLLRGFDASGTDQGGDVTLEAGDGGASGNVNITAGGNSIGFTAGSVSLNGGTGTGSPGGHVLISGGTGTTNGSVRFFTNSTERFEIRGDGGWELGGNQGTSGQVLTSNGAGTAPTWQTSAAVSEPANQIVYGTGTGVDSDPDLTYVNTTGAFFVNTINGLSSSVSVAAPDPVGIFAPSHSGTGAGGSITIQAGTGGATSGNGGAVSISGGPANDGNGGGIQLTGRPGVGTDRNGGNITISAGSSTGAGSPGNIAIAAGLGGTTGTGGSTIIAAGNGGSISGDGGAVFVTGGLTTSGSGGSAYVRGAAGTGSNSGGTVYMEGGAAGTGTGTAGAVQITGGGGGQTSGAGGEIFIDGGDASVFGTGGSGGSVNITGGDAIGSSTGGSIYLAGGLAGATGQGGVIQLAAGNGGATSGNGGGLLLSGGNATTAGAGGPVNISGGDGSASGNGGAISVTAGVAGATGTGGNITMSAGTGGSTSGDGGSVTVRGGSVTSGDEGDVLIGRGTTTASRNGNMMHIPTTAGTPTGTPNTVAGYVPLVFDTTNNIMYVYSGGTWKTNGITWT